MMVVGIKIFKGRRVVVAVEPIIAAIIAIFFIQLSIKSKLGIGLTGFLWGFLISLALGTLFGFPLGMAETATSTSERNFYRRLFGLITMALPICLLIFIIVKNYIYSS